MVRRFLLIAVCFMLFSSAAFSEETGFSDESMFSKRDCEEAVHADEETAFVSLFENGAACEDEDVQIDGTTITFSREKTYILEGEIKNGRIVVNADKSSKLRIVLKNAVIHSEDGAAILIEQADKVFLTLYEGSQNVLSNGGSFDASGDTKVDGALFSREDLTLNGAGKLKILSPAGNGVVCKDDLAITGGEYEIECTGHALEANDSIRIKNAKADIKCGKDALHAENDEDAEKGYVYVSGGEYTLDAGGDGVSASGDLFVSGGAFTITAGGGSAQAQSSRNDRYGGFHGRYGAQYESEEDTESCKGLKSGGMLAVTGGEFKIDSKDDAVHSNASAKIGGGKFLIATGDDAFHAEESLLISDGTIDITKSYEGLEALSVTVAGGNITVVSDDDGLNAAGGNDGSGLQGEAGMGGYGGGRNMRGGRGGPGGMGGASSNGKIVISGGSLHVTASGDGIDSNGSIEITGGYTVVEGPVHGDTATLDYDTTAVITGGTFIGTGARGMAQTFSEGAQGVIAVSVGNQPENTAFSVFDSEGTLLLRHVSALGYCVVIVSSPDIAAGQTYTLEIGEMSGEVSAY